MWARVEDGTVMEVTDIDPEGRFHPDLKWWPCSANVLPGWLFENDTFAAKVKTVAERKEAERYWRDGELTARQWLRDRHRDELELGRPTTLSNEQFAEFLMYLQALRDWPVAEAFPDPQKRPPAPSWIDLYTQ